MRLDKWIMLSMHDKEKASLIFNNAVRRVYALNKPKCVKPKRKLKRRKL